MEHKIIIQRLNSSRYNNGILTEYPVEAFKNVSFDGIPLILDSGKHVKHPSINDVKNNTLSDNYKIVGYVRDSQIIEAGTPRIEGMVDIDDESLSNSISNCNYALSSGFEAMTRSLGNGQIISGDVVPNHVLIFPVTSGEPNDGMAAFLNLRDTDLLENIVNEENIEKIEKNNKIEENNMVNTMATQKMTKTPLKNVKKIIKVINNADEEKKDKEEIIEQIEEVEEVEVSTTADEVEEVAEVVEEVVDQAAEKDALISLQTSTIESLQSQVDSLTAEVARLNEIIAQQEADKVWDDVSEKIPEELQNKRELFEKNPQQFLIEYANLMNKKNINIKKTVVAKPAVGKITEFANTQASKHVIVQGYEVRL